MDQPVFLANSLATVTTVFPSALMFLLTHKYSHSSSAGTDSLLLHFSTTNLASGVRLFATFSTFIVTAYETCLTI